ncbi:hypothetical protein HMI54_011275, partial [Coelomomyces lativittatus]
MESERDTTGAIQSPLHANIDISAKPSQQPIPTNQESPPKTHRRTNSSLFSNGSPTKGGPSNLLFHVTGGTLIDDPLLSPRNSIIQTNTPSTPLSNTNNSNTSNNKTPEPHETLFSSSSSSTESSPLPPHHKR